MNLAQRGIKDISFLSGLSGLTKLYLSRNQLTERHLAPLRELKHLKLLDVSDNQIRQLPPDITSWWPGMEIGCEVLSLGGRLNLHGNPLTHPPIEIVKKGKAGINAYFDSLKGETLPLNEFKVLLVGDGGAGKTSLVKRLMGKKFNNDEPQTHGININPWEVKRQKTPIKIHLWDFGGQEIMHATHQFFLSKRSLYILVLDGRKDDKTEYWLKHIRSFGGDSPVLVVLNKIDQHPGFELNRRFLQEKYPNITDFFRLSCAENTGIDDFKKALEKAIRSVEIIRTTWAKSWFQVKQSLEKMTEPYISLQQYNSLCLKENIEDPAGRDTLVDFLHDLGVILHFDDLGLGDVHVLEPHWATEAVYKIINSTVAAANKGILKPAFLADILKQKKIGDYYYPPDKHHYIVELMKKFEICYQLITGDILIPDLLAVEEIRFEFEYARSLPFIFQYDFLPPSVMPRFIVRMQNDIKDNYRWRTGVLLENKAFNSTAVVKSDYEEKKIYIYVNGQQKRDYFSVIRHTIREINAGFKNINTVELVPLPEAKEITVEYDDLIGLEQMGKEFISIGKLKKDFSVKSLLIINTSNPDIFW
ncbi:MAG: internalin [Acidobacteriota bacterium]|nr:internalin [Acidobacteriota bacterium]